MQQEGCQLAAQRWCVSLAFGIADLHQQRYQRYLRYTRSDCHYSAAPAEDDEGEVAPAKSAGKQRKGKGKAAAETEEGGPVRLPMNVSQQLTGG
jgi:hypothetical protein